MNRLLLALVCISLALTACTTKAPATGSPPRPTGSLAVRVQFRYGLIGPGVRNNAMPQFTLLTDGRMLTPTAGSASAITAITERRVSAADVTKILNAAVDAGLTKGIRTIPAPGGHVEDAGAVVFTVIKDRVASTTVVDALSLPGSTETGERGAIASFKSRLDNLESWLPAGSVGGASTYSYAALRVAVMPSPAGAPKGAAVHEWPLATPLTGFGLQLDGANAGVRCGVVRQSDLQTLKTAVEASSAQDLWRSSGQHFTLGVRPMLPDETSCRPLP